MKNISSTQFCGKHQAFHKGQLDKTYFEIENIIFIKSEHNKIQVITVYERKEYLKTQKVS